MINTRLALPASNRSTVMVVRRPAETGKVVVRGGGDVNKMRRTLGMPFPKRGVVARVVVWSPSAAVPANQGIRLHDRDPSAGLQGERRAVRRFAGATLFRRCGVVVPISSLCSADGANCGCLCCRACVGCGSQSQVTMRPPCGRCGCVCVWEPPRS